MIEFITGAAGSGKSTLMLDKISALIDQDKEICIIVPEQYSNDFDKKLYRKIGPVKFNRLTSQSFTGLARQLFQLYGEGSRSGDYADEYSRMILIHLAVSSVQKMPGALQYFGKLSTRQGFAEEILDLIVEMKRSGITPEMLQEKALFFDNKLMNKMNDVSAVYLEYERLMKEYGFKDNLDDLKEASSVAALNNYFSGKNVFIDEFESFTGDQLNFIKNIIANAENVSITLRTDDVNAGEYTLFETVNSTYRSIAAICRESNKKYTNIRCTESYRFRNDDIKYLSENILRNKEIHSEDAPAVSNVGIFEAKDVYSEVEYVCATIRRLIYADVTLKYRDIAVISNNIASYSEVLKSAFERYDIPYFLSIEKSVIHTSLMIFFTTLLDILNQKKYHSELIFRYLKCGLTDISLTDIALLENYCYKWSVDGSTWKESFTAPDENLEKIEHLRDSVISPLEALKSKISKKISADKICRLLYNFLVESGAETAISQLMSKLIAENKDYEAAEMKRLWGCLIDILDSVSDTFGENILTFTEISGIFKSMAGSIEYSLPPQTLDSVVAASARTARLDSPRIVFVIGANEGDFPNTVKLKGLFSEADKQKMSQQKIEISRHLADVIASERLVVYKSLSAASEKLIITYPLSDLSGQAKYPAGIIYNIYELFGSRDILTTESQITSDYYSVTMRSAFYHYMQSKNNESSYAASMQKLLSESPDYSRKIEYILMRSRHRQNFEVSTDIMERLSSFTPFYVSPSAFELYNTCHFKYFCSKCLNLFINEKVELDMRFTGSLIHLCFYKIISSRNKEDFVNMPYDLLKKEIFSSAEEFRKKELGGEFSKAPRFELSFNKITEQLVKVFVHTQHEIMASSFIPSDFEINLRDKRVNSALELEFAGNKKLSFGGVIDRADISTINGGKYVRIIDYKSNIKKIDPVLLSNGINMQMLMYLFAITDKNGVYSDYTPAGVLYSPLTIMSVELDDKIITTENTSAIDSSLRPSGLVLSDRDVLEAMEENIAGNYIPVSLDKKNEITKNSECVTADSFNRLRDYTYHRLTEMAESVYSGNAGASPLFIKGKTPPCEYCEFVNICGNNDMSEHRIAEENILPEIEKLLNAKTEEDTNDAKMD